MATKTAGAAQASVFPRTIHAGAIHAVGKFSIGGTPLSSGDKLLMLKVPHAAIINSCSIFVHPSAGAGIGFRVGDGGDDDRFIASTNFSNNVRVAHIDNNLGHRYSFSDNDGSRYDIVEALVKAVSSADSAGYILVDVGYHLDELSPGFGAN